MAATLPVRAARPLRGRRRAEAQQQRLLGRQRRQLKPGDRQRAPAERGAARYQPRRWLGLREAPARRHPLDDRAPAELCHRLLLPNLRTPRDSTQPTTMTPIHYRSVKGGPRNWALPAPTEGGG